MRKFKKMLTICLIASLAVTAFGCSNGSTSSESSEPKTGGDGNSVADNGNENSVADAPAETLSPEQVKTPFTFVHVGSEDEEATEVGEEKEEKSTETTADTQAASAIAIVPVTEVVNVTDEKGQVATDAKGQPQTEVVNMTEVVKVTDNKGQEQTEAVNVTETAIVTDAAQPATLKPDDKVSNYTPSYDSYKTYWLDMSQESDFFFDGEFLTIEFEINKDAPDGLYPVTIENPDIASWEVKTWTPKIIAGQVAVNSTPDAQDALPESDFGLKLNSVSGKPGDTVTMTVDLKNNPGFCGFVLEIKYDAGAMKILEINGGEDFNNNAVNYVSQNN